MGGRVDIKWRMAQRVAYGTPSGTARGIWHAKGHVAWHVDVRSMTSRSAHRITRVCVHAHPRASCMRACAHAMLPAPVCACTWEADLGVSRAKPASITSADHRTSVNATAVEASAPCAASALAEAHRRGAVPDDCAGEGAAGQHTFI